MVEDLVRPEASVAGDTGRIQVEHHADDRDFDYVFGLLGALLSSGRQGRQASTSGGASQC
jgi:hypothetical protein